MGQVVFWALVVGVILVWLNRRWPSSGAPSSRVLPRTEINSSRTTTKVHPGPQQAAIAAAAVPVMSARAQVPVLPVAAVEPMRVSFRVAAATEVARAPAPPQPAPPLSVRWIDERETVSIAGCTITGGLFYMGTMSSSSAFRGEPSVVDPTLAVGPTGSYACWTASYWPQYATCTPADRRALLNWLASGRKDPAAPIGLVFLYFYGLERRLLDDAQTMPSARADVPRLIAEIDRLRRIYNQGSFFGYASSLRDLAVALYGDAGHFRPSNECRPGVLSSGLLVALGRRIHEGLPLTASLAYGWARGLDGAPRPGAVRLVADELQALFEHRYKQLYGAGLIVPAPRRSLTLDHRGAAFNRVSLRLRLDAPDIRSITAPQRPLAVLLDACFSDLQPLARARKSEPVQPLEVAAALPPELKASGVLNVLAPLKAFAENASGSNGIAIASVDALLSAAGVALDERLGKRECRTVITALERLGFGVEPDVRWAGPVLAQGGKAVIYRFADIPASAPTANYRLGQLFLQMAVAVAAADGSIDPDELDLARQHLDGFVRLGQSERERLHAHLTWLTTVKPSAAKLLSQLKALDNDQRLAMADAAIRVAAADGRIDPGEMRTLDKIYRALGLDPSTISGEVHRILTCGSNRVTSLTGAALDAEAIARKMQETADVQRLLTAIFSEEDGAPGTTLDVASSKSVSVDDDVLSMTERVDAVPGLDEAHAALLHRLLDKTTESVKRSEVDSWCHELGLMTDGALESVNEVAYSLAGDALFDADEEVVIRSDVRDTLKQILEGVSA